MKGIIAEIHGSHMIVIAKNGDFSRCKKLPNCDIGDEINIPERNMKSVYKNLTAIAASFLILIMLSSGVYAYYTPYSYVSVDINPSMELYVNRFDKVIGVHAFNEEAAQIIKASNGMKNKNVDDALEQVLNKAEEAGYLKKDGENTVMIVVSSENKKEEADITNKMSKTSTDVLSKLSGDYEVILEKTQVEKYKKAKEQNISPGKVILANRFKEAKPEIDEEKVKNMPLQQAIKQIEKKEDKMEKPDKSVGVSSEKPKVKSEIKGNVMNIKELIEEKNEELGNKLEKEKEKVKENSKDNNKDKDNSKNDDKEKNNTGDKEKEKDKDKNKK
jgi:hypothetical protein